MKHFLLSFWNISCLPALDGLQPEVDTGLVWRAYFWCSYQTCFLLWSYLEVLPVGFSCQHFCLGKHLFGSAVPLSTQMYLFNILNLLKISGKMITILLTLLGYFYRFQNISTFIGSSVFFHSSNSSFNPIQSGFLPHHSTKAALIKLSNNFHVVKSHVTSLALS